MTKILRITLTLKSIKFYDSQYPNLNPIPRQDCGHPGPDLAGGRLRYPSIRGGELSCIIQVLVDTRIEPTLKINEMVPWLVYEPIHFITHSTRIPTCMNLIYP